MDAAIQKANGKKVLSSVPEAENLIVTSAIAGLRAAVTGSTRSIRMASRRRRRFRSLSMRTPRLRATSEVFSWALHSTGILSTPRVRPIRTMPHRRVTSCSWI